MLRYDYWRCRSLRSDCMTVQRSFLPLDPGTTSASRGLTSCDRTDPVYRNGEDTKRAHDAVISTSGPGNVKRLCVVSIRTGVHRDWVRPLPLHLFALGSVEERFTRQSDRAWIRASLCGRPE